jgi:hypothetical protein
MRDLPRCTTSPLHLAPGIASGRRAGPSSLE